MVHSMIRYTVVLLVVGIVSSTAYPLLKEPEPYQPYEDDLADAVATTEQVLDQASDVLSQVAVRGDVGGDGKTDTYAAVRLTQFMETYFRIASAAGQQALKDLGKKIKAWLLSVKKTKKKWDFLYILVSNLERIYPKYQDKAAKLITEVFSRVKRNLDVPNTPYYLTVEDIDFQYLRVEPFSLKQIPSGPGLDLKFKGWIQGSVHIAISKWSADASVITPLIRFKVEMNDPLDVEFNAQVRVGKRVGQTTVKVDTTILDLSKLKKFDIITNVRAYKKEIAAILSRLETVRADMQTLAGAMLRWKKGTIVKSISHRLGKMLGDMEFFSDDLNKFSDYGGSMSLHIMKELVLDGAAVNKLSKMISAKVMPDLEQALAKVADNADLINILNQPRGAGETDLELAVPKLLMNTPFLQSDFGQRLQNLVLSAFIIQDVTYFERMRYRQRKEEAEHGGAMNTLWQCAKKRCADDHRENKYKDHTCNPSRLLDYRALRSLAYRTPLNSRTRSKSRRICYNSATIPLIISRKQPEAWCCSVDTRPDGSLSPVRVTNGPCTIESCLQRSLPPAIHNLQVTYGKNNKKEITRSAAKWKYVSFKGKNKPADIADDRWHAKATLMWYLHGHADTFLNDIQLAWTDKKAGEKCPPGYKKLHKSYNNQESANLNQGWGTRKKGFKHAYLCLLYGPLSKQSIVDIELLYGPPRAASTGFHVLRKSVSGKYSANFNYKRMSSKKEAVHIAFRRLSSLSSLPALLKARKVKTTQHLRHWSDPENKRPQPNGLPALVTAAESALAITANLDDAGHDDPSHTDSVLPVSMVPVQGPSTEAEAETETALAPAVAAYDEETYPTADILASAMEPVNSGWGVYLNLARGEDMDGALGVKLLMYDFAVGHFHLKEASLKYNENAPTGPAEDAPKTAGIEVELHVALEARTHAVVEGAGGITGGFGKIVSFFRGREADIDATAERFAGVQADKVIWRTKPDRPLILTADLAIKATLFWTGKQWEFKITRTGFGALSLTFGEQKYWIIEKAAVFVKDRVSKMHTLVESAFITLTSNLAQFQAAGPDFANMKDEGAELEVSLKVSLPRRLFKTKAIAKAYDILKTVIDENKDSIAGGIGVTE